MKSLVSYSNSNIFQNYRYTDLGGALCITMLTEAIVPHIVRLFDLFIVKRVKRRMNFFTKELYTQKEMNDFYIDGQMNLALKYPSLLNNLFVTLMYSSALPLLIPIAFFSFTLQYFMDKWLLLKYYSKPPSSDESQGLLRFVWNARILYILLFQSCSFISSNSKYLNDQIRNYSSFVYILVYFWK